MKFGKTYSALVYAPEFPEEWRAKAINYRQLKKLINQVAIELSALGLNPGLLQKLLDDQVICAVGSDIRLGGSTDLSCVGAIYEVVESPGTEAAIAPHIRLRLAGEDSTTNELSGGPRTTPPSPILSSSPDRGTVSWLPEPSTQRPESLSSYDSDESNSPSGINQLTPLPGSGSQTVVAIQDPDPQCRELVIPLSSDSAFFQLLSNALITLSTLHENTIKNSSAEISLLADIISSTSRPVSNSPKISKPLKKIFSAENSDLYAWRTIFQLWVEMEIFESISEHDRGERSPEEAETRLRHFGEELCKRGLSDGANTFVIDQSKEALRRFLKLNALILDLKKFQFANAEATRKILKKHEKRTALPSTAVTLVPSLNLQLRGVGVSLPHALLVTITQTLLPVIPSIDDYSCLICSSIAFKPIRLACGHLFCVRCLAKMQKQGLPQFANCALCRAPTVFEADRSNLDEALMRFMKDWFPKETKIKARENEREVAAELAEELGIASRRNPDADEGCWVM